jgi:hypothetical protein
MRKTTALKRLHKLGEDRRNLQREIDGLVSMLRSPGTDGQCLATWAEVGAALGVTRQTVQEKYRQLSWLG